MYLFMAAYIHKELIIAPILWCSALRRIISCVHCKFTPRESEAIRYETLTDAWDTLYFVGLFL